MARQRAPLADGVNLLVCVRLDVQLHQQRAAGLRQVGFKVCVECLIGKQKKPILRVFKVTEPSSVRTAPPVPAKMCLVLKWLRVKGLGVCTVGGVCVFNTAGPTGCVGNSLWLTKSGEIRVQELKTFTSTQF